MDERACRRLVEAFWSAMRANDGEGAAAFLSEHVVLDYPQSGERIRGRANVVAVNRDYPTSGRWRLDVHRMVVDAAAQTAISDVAVATSGRHDRVVSFSASAFKATLVRRMPECLPVTFGPADWRTGIVDRIGEPGRSDGGRERLPI